MTHTQSFLSSTRQNYVPLDLAIALTNASVEEFSAAMEQLPPEKRQRMAIALLMKFDLAEKIEIFKQLSLEQTGEVTVAIAQVWQEGD